MTKLALVTGGRKGIGFACAEALAGDGYFVVITGRRRRAEPAHPRMAYLACDVTDRADIRRALKVIATRYGRIDLLVSNAGVAPKVRRDLLDTTETSFDFVVGTNLKGSFFMIQAVARAMVRARERDRGYTPRIIVISSVSAYASSVNRGEYCISKAGLSMVTALFADRLAGCGIPVFEVRPGIILTDMTAPVKDRYETMVAGGLTPIRRLGTPGDVAGCVSALAGGRFDFATGQVINADGGFHLRRL